LRQCGSRASILPPTTLFNEGWMLRLILDWYGRNRSYGGMLVLENDATWYSEGLLASRFFATRRGDPRAEGWTHADAVIGHFHLGSDSRGDIDLDSDAAQFTVIEAKMASPLSSGTKNAPGFHQAARSVACMAHLLDKAGRHPEEMARLEFLVLAPRSRIAENVFADQLSQSGIEQAIRQRAAVFVDSHTAWLRDWLAPFLPRCAIRAVAWEDLVADVKLHDQTFGADLARFYDKCLQFNLRRSYLGSVDANAN
jgi:hypothetical protein